MCEIPQQTAAGAQNIATASFERLQIRSLGQP